MSSRDFSLICVIDILVFNCARPYITVAYCDRVAMKVCVGNNLCLLACRLGETVQVLRPELW